MIFKKTGLLTIILAFFGLINQSGAQPTGTAIAPVPTLSYSNGEGLEYGGKLFIYRFGDGVRQPYHWNVNLNFARTTLDRTDLYLFTDIPHLFGPHSRLDFRLEYKNLQLENYYGLGNATSYQPQFTEEASPEFQSDEFYSYKRRATTFTINTQIPIAARGLRWLMGLGFSHTRTAAYPEPNAYAENIPYGHRGGNTNYVRFGLVLDHRDQETLPHRGIWSDLLFESSQRLLGSDYQYTRLTMTHRSYLPLHPRLVLANRTVLELMSGSPPFYEMAVISSSYQRQEGLGGSKSLRGVPRLLFIGEDKLFSNLELRWRFDRMTILRQDLTWYLNLFTDAGRVWIDGDASTLKDLHFSYGFGLAVQWKKDFIGSIDIGRSPYLSKAVYLNFGSLF